MGHNTGHDSEVLTIRNTLIFFIVLISSAGCYSASSVEKPASAYRMKTFSGIGSGRTCRSWRDCLEPDSMCPDKVFNSRTYRKDWIGCAKTALARNNDARCGLNHPLKYMDLTKQYVSIGQVATRQRLHF
jgi:hypothetical protein